MCIQVLRLLLANYYGDTPQGQEFFIIAFIFVLDKENLMYNMPWFMEGWIFFSKAMEDRF